MRATATQATGLRSLPVLIVGGVLGLNVWATLLAVPVTHALQTKPIQAALPLWTLGLPLPILVLGLFRLSRVFLLGLFPITLAALVAIFRGPTGPDIFSVWTFALAGCSLIGYLVGTTMILEVRARRDDRESAKRLTLPPLAEKWKRRRRMYILLAICSALVPLAMLYSIDFFPSTAKALKAEYEARAQDMMVLFNVCALALWVVLFTNFFMEPLELHRRGDADLRLELRRLERKLERQRPRWPFYLLIAAALGLMVLLIVMKR